MKAHTSKFSFFRLALIVAFSLAFSGCTTKEESSEAYVASAQQYLDDGKPELALVEARNALRINPKNTEAYLTTVTIQEELEQWQGMHNNLERLLEINPDHVQAKYKLARLVFLAGDNDRAQALASDILVAEPKNVEYLTLRAAIHFRDNNTLEAMNLAKSAIELDSSNLEATGILVALEIVAKNYSAAHEAISQAMLTTPNSPELLGLRAQVQAGERNLPGMTTTIRRIIELQPNELRYRRALASVLLQTESRSAAQAVLQESVNDNPDSVEARLTLATFIAKEDPSAAIKRLREFVEQSPEEADLQLWLGKALTEAGNSEEAFDTYQQLADSDLSRPATAVAKSEMARIALSDNESEVASEIVQDILADDPNHPEALLLSSYISTQSGDFDAGISKIRRVLRNEPGNDRALELLGRIYLLQNSIPLAKESFAASLAANPYNAAAANHQAKLLLREGEIEKASQLLRPLISAGRGNPESHRLLIQLELSLKNWNDAQSLADTYPNVAIRRNVTTLVDALVEQGRGNYQKAIDSFLTLINVKSVREAALAGLVSSYSQLGDNESALKLLGDIIKADPADLGAITMMAQELRRNQESPERIQGFWEQNLTNNPDWAEGHLAFGNDLSAAREYQRALSAYSRSYDLQAAGSTKLMMALTYEQLGNVNQAVGLYRELLEEAPNSMLVRNNLSMLLAKNEATQEEALQIAKPLATTDQPYYLDTVGWLHALNGDQAKAIDLLKEAVTLSPDIGEFRFHLGFARYQLQQIDDAKVEISEALSKPERELANEEWREEATLLLQQM